MADRPLRPATDHCLGRPLPPQLANRPQPPPPAAPRKVPFLIAPTWATSLYGITPRFRGLPPTSGQVGHVFLTRPPRETPEGIPVRLACIRHAASVDPEPGSNSPPLPGPVVTGLRDFVLRAVCCAPIRQGTPRPDRSRFRNLAQGSPHRSRSLLRLWRTTSRHPLVPRPSLSGFPRDTNRLRRSALHLLRCCRSIARRARRPPCIPTGRKSLTPSPGLLERRVARRRAACDLLFPSRSSRSGPPV